MTLFFYLKGLTMYNVFELFNSQNTKIEFTTEIEENSKLSFLDVTVCKDHGMFVTSVYKKSTFTGLGMKFTSFVPRGFKINLISCLIITH